MDDFEIRHTESRKTKQPSTYQYSPSVQVLAQGRTTVACVGTKRLHWPLKALAANSFTSLVRQKRFMNPCHKLARSNITKCVGL